MKLYATIYDRETNKEERVILCSFLEFENDESETIFIKRVERHDTEMFLVLIDEGYVHTEYYYPIERYTITDLTIFE